MNKLFLAAGVAAMAIAAPAAAEKGGKGGGGGGGQAAAKAERGGGGGGGGGHAPQMNRGGGGGHAPKMHRGGGGGGGHAAPMQRGGGGHAAHMQRGGGGGERMRMARPGGGERAAQRPHRMERGGGNAMRVARQDRRPDRVRTKAMRGNDRSAMRVEKREFQRQERAQVRVDNRPSMAMREASRPDRSVAMNNVSQIDRWENVRSSAYGCPPGLAAKNNGCLPPGHAKQMIGSVLPAAYASAYLPDALRTYYADDDDYYYRYGDGYIYRVDRDDNLIASLLPLFGGSYLPGQVFPLSNANYMVPSYYSSFYPDSPYSAYRYDDGYLYEVDPYSGMVENVVPMLGFGYGVGQMLPAGYSAYNVPYQYRDIYYDTDDAYYRYAPGAIYQVDPQTNLITSVASLLTGQPLGMGQQLPMGYDVYNVPYAYRDRYYDTNDAWYRYADGNIYQVDPTTRLITAVIDAIV